MILIGISGKKTSGKTTCAEIIKELFPNKTIIINFGDAVKESLKVIFDFSDSELYGDDKEKVNEFWNITPREVMQFYATDLMRNQLSKRFETISTNLWVKCVEKKIIKLLNKDVIVIIADLRFMNEYEMIKKYNGITLRINRNTTGLYDKHQSEIELDNVEFDYNISNNSTTEDLIENVIEFIENFNIS